MLITSNHPMIRLSQEFAKLCEPLKSFNIQQVTYQKIFNRGGRISLSSKPKWIEDYFNLKLYDSSLFENIPTNTKHEFALWLGEYSLEIYKYGRDYYDSDGTISIVEPVQDGCETFLFATSKKHQKSLKYLSTNRHILYHFILYMRDKAKKLFEEASQNKIIFSQQKNKIELLQEDSVVSLEQAKKQFFQATPIHKYTYDDIIPDSHFTQREIDCLKDLFNNRSAADTADRLGLSRRTVESYLESIKSKLNCNNKKEIYSKLQNSVLFKAFIEIQEE